MIAFAHGQYAMLMRSDGQDVIDIYGLKQNAGYDYDGIMQIGNLDVFPNITPNMTDNYFDVPIPYYGYGAAGWGHIAPYVKASVGTYEFYLFIDRVEAINSEETRCYFSIDWWATWYCNRGATKPLYTLKGAFVNRSNRHIVTTPSEGITEVKAGQGRETIQAMNLPVLHSEVAYKTVAIGDDSDVRFLRFTFSDKKQAEGIFQDLLPTKNDLSNGLYYCFLPLIPAGKYGAIRIRAGTFQIQQSYANYIKYTNAATRVLTLTPACVSVELLPLIPLIKSTDTFSTTQGNRGIEIVLDTDKCLVTTSTDAALKDNVVVIQTGVINGDKVYEMPRVATFMPTVEAEGDGGNFPVGTAYYDAVGLAQYYTHNNFRDQYPVEPKLAQPQYTRCVFTDRAGGELVIAPHQHGSEIQKLQVIGDYLGSTFKQKYWLSDGVKAYANDKDGTSNAGINDKLYSYPLINDAYINYMNGRKNQIINGLAVTKATGIANTVSRGIEAIGTLGVGIGDPKKASIDAGHQAINDLQNVLKSEWAFEAQTADLKEQVKTVESKAGNNAEFDLQADNGRIVRQIWSVDDNDRKRLAEYFHRNGYAVGEYQTDISLDTMYYFDYIQATDINFYAAKNESEEQGRYMWNKPCDDYMRALFARGVRIWHGRRKAEHFPVQLFNTSYLNTAKEF